MRLIARMVFWYCSRSYLSGRLRFFSNSNVVSYTVPGHSERQQSSNCSVVKRLGALAMRERSSQQASEPAAYQHQLLASGPPEGLGPSHLARVALHLEVVVAFATTESKDLRTNQPDRCTHALLQMSNTRSARWSQIDRCRKRSSITRRTYRGVIAHERNSVARVDRSTAEPTLEDSHHSSPASLTEEGVRHAGSQARCRCCVLLLLREREEKRSRDRAIERE